MAEAPNVATTYSASELKSSNLEMVLDIKNLEEKWRTATLKQRQREYRNRRAYFGIDAGQWRTTDVNELNNQDRDPDQFNIIQRRVDILLGNEMTQVWDFDWEPVEGQPTSGTEAIKETYYSDKEQMNYDVAIDQTLKDGIITSGACEMNISKKYNPAGNINLERLLPGYYIWDPYWISDDDNDCERFMKIGYFSALQIKRIWNKSTPRIEAEIQKILRNQGEYVEKNLENMADIIDERRGHLFKVLEYSYLKHINEDKLFGWVFNENGFASLVPFPDTKDESEIRNFAEYNKIDWRNTFVTKQKRRILKVCAVCNELVESGVLVDNVDDEVQINRINKFHFAYNRENGIDKGVVDDLYDLQKNINRRESKETNILESSTGGGKLINKNIFNTEGQRTRFMDEGTSPTYREFIDGDELAKGVPAVIDLHSANFPGQILDIPRLYQLADILTPVTTAQTGSTEAANATGVLYERQLAVSRIGQLPLDRRIRKLMNDLGEAYFYQWQITYDGVPRQFKTRDGKHSAFLNEIVYDGEGNKGYQNRPKYTPRCRVIVTESPKSESWQMRRRAFWADMLKFIPPNYTAHISFVMSSLFKTMDLSDKEKAQLEMFQKVQGMKDLMTTMTEMANLTAGKEQANLAALQAQMMIQQMIQQMQQPEIGMMQAQGQLPPEATPQITMDNGGQPVEFAPEQIAGLQNAGEVPENAPVQAGAI